jgi:arginine/lysine/ornithine decarboxylase
MRTPIYDFVKAYADSKAVRFHMPGHKGRGALGFEQYDITEIKGADVLYSADGIINESENNLTSLYGTAHSFYSTEGSTLAIKAMLAIVSERKSGERPFILAARNVHAAFVRAAALLDLDVGFIYSEREGHLCECKISADEVREAIVSSKKKPCAVYVTSPDYLGNMLDIRGISRVCSEFEVPLLVDNAHGAYLRFLPENLHPISLGAAMCADSAHKTLPVLTGGAYLHISKDHAEYADKARRALSLFASTSPSYLTLSSLDLCNKTLAEEYPEKLLKIVNKTLQIKAKIVELGFFVAESEPLKIVVGAGESFAEHLRSCGIEPEFSDKDYTVLMLTPDNEEMDFDLLISAFSSFEGERAFSAVSPSPGYHERELSVREAVLSPGEIIDVNDAEGRICASPTVSCPPAVPIVVSGEKITGEDVRLFKHYGINAICVVK